MNYCAEFPEEKTYSEKEYHESLNRLTHAATEIKNLNREINELRNELEQTKKRVGNRETLWRSANDHSGRSGCLVC